MKAMFDKVDKKTGKRLEKLAMQECFLIADRGGLDTRNSDSEDFLDIAVWYITRLMESAYLMGLNDAKKAKG